MSNVGGFAADFVRVCSMKKHFLFVVHDDMQTSCNDPSFSHVIAHAETNPDPDKHLNKVLEVPWCQSHDGKCRKMQQELCGAFHSAAALFATDRRRK